MGEGGGEKEGAVKVAPNKKKKILTIECAADDNARNADSELVFESSIDLSSVDIAGIIGRFERASRRRDNKFPV